MKSKTMFIAFIVALIPWLSSCSSDEGGSKNINIDLNPEKPFVTNSGSSYVDNNGDTQTVEGPWTRGSFTITNNHPTLDLYVDSLKVTFINSEGVENDYTVSLDEACDSGSGRLFYANIAQGGGVFVGDVNCDGIDGDRETWYFSSLPDSSTFVYTVTVELSGYFHDNDTTSPLERASKIIYAVTK